MQSFDHPPCGKYVFVHYFEHPRYRNAPLSACYAELQKASLKGADLRGAFLKEVDLRGANLDGAQLHQLLYVDVKWPRGFDAQAAGAKICQAGANLSGMKFDGFDFSYLDLSGCNLSNSSLVGTKLEAVELNDANLENKQNEQLNDSTDKSNPGSIANNNDEAEIAQEDNNKVVEKPYVRPVPGKVLRAYNPTATSDKNEGIDFHADPGTPIKAAADGVVALISKPVGGLGKIVLIKHDKSVISIYGRVKDLIVSKGSRVVQGQIIGKVEMYKGDY